MAPDEISRIRVGNTLIGIAGLKAAITEIAEGFGERPDQEIAEELLNRLGRRNYIPEKAREEYEKLFSGNSRNSLESLLKTRVLEGWRSRSSGRAAPSATGSKTNCLKPWPKQALPGRWNTFGTSRPSVNTASWGPRPSSSTERSSASARCRHGTRSKNG
jgi:hypothetical protein